VGQRIGYQRVSTVDQNTDRQLDGVELDKVFTDKASGKNTDRPELAALSTMYAKATQSSFTRWTDSLATSKIYAE
jgi:DNA invertase Pin-like site-specific DNA recombinase